MDSVSATSPRGPLGGRSGLHKSSTFKSAKSTIVTEDSKYLGSVHSYHEVCTYYHLGLLDWYSDTLCTGRERGIGGLHQWITAQSL